MSHAFLAASRLEYSYDNAGQLTGGTRFGPKLDNTEGTVVQYGYQYDSMGSRANEASETGAPRVASVRSDPPQAEKRQLSPYSAPRPQAWVLTPIMT